MKIQNNKTRLLTSMVICAILTMNMTQMSFGQTTTQNKTLDPSLLSDTTCFDKIQQDEKIKYTSFDEKKAITSASESNNFKAEVKSDKYSNGHVVMIWSYDPVNCVASPKDASVQFMVTDTTGQQRLVIVNEDPKSLTPGEISVDRNVITHTVPSAPRTTWTGYELKGNLAGTNGVYQSALTYLVPTAAVPTLPSGFTCGTSGSQQCDAAVWSGIAVGSGGNHGLVQTGTDSICSGTSGSNCVNKIYHAWLEFYNSDLSSDNIKLDCAVRPGNLVPAANDNMISQVTNYAKYGQGTNLYDLFLVDVTQNIQCTSFGVGFNSGDKGSPYYAEYILERPSVSGSNYRLGGFGTEKEDHIVLHPIRFKLLEIWI